MAGRVRPPALNAAVSAQMSRMPRASTVPELAVRRELHRRGLRFRVNLRDLPGRPDVALTRARIAVFIDGCFWHMCPDHCVLPKNNGEWWQQKLRANVARDRRTDARVTELGWLPVHAWEHDEVGVVADLIEQLWSQRRHTPGHHPRALGHARRI